MYDDDTILCLFKWYKHSVYAGKKLICHDKAFRILVLLISKSISSGFVFPINYFTDPNSEMIDAPLGLGLQSVHSLCWTLSPS